MRILPRGAARGAFPATFAFVSAVALVHAPLAAQGAAPPQRALVEVVVSGPAQMQRLLAMDLDLAACRTPLPAQRRVEVVTYPGDLERLQRAGMQCTVIVPDLAAAHARALALATPAAGTDGLTPPIGQGAMGGHHTLAEMEAILDAFHQQYPQLCSAKVSIGQSIQGRQLWLVKISDNVGIDENEPEVFFDALHHAREPLSMSATLLFMDELLSGYGTDPEATFLIEQRELWFVPCVNPDGYEYNRQIAPNGGGMWRKNRRANAGGTFGVDLNRNYASFWNAPNGGSSTSPGSDTYRGTAPFSEPETQAIEAFAASRPLALVMTTHTHGDVMLRPYGYQQQDPANVASYAQQGAFLVEDSGIPHGSISSLLYIASGTSVDHHHTARGTVTWSGELGRTGEGNFWPVGMDIERIARRHQPMFRRLALTAGPAFTFVDVAVTEAPGGNANGTIEPGETAHVVATVQNLGIAAAPLSLALVPNDPNIVIGTGAAALGTLGAQAAGGNAGTPLTFTLAPGFAGAVAHLALQASGDGRVSTRLLEVPTRPARRCVDDDFELARGFVRGESTATTGLWERAAPQATFSGSTPIQPGAQTTPGGTLCHVTGAAAGGSAGGNDVDGGFTELRSPVLDLAHVQAAEVAFDLWFVSTGGADPLQVQWSRDGGANWSTLLSRTASTSGWQRVALPLPGPMTAAVVLRVRAIDHAGSVVEALLDELEVRGAAPDGAVTLLASGALGTSLRAGMNAPDGSLLVPLAALGTVAPTPIAGVAGALRLDPASLVLLAPQLPSGGYAAVDVAVPNQPGLVGVTVAFQCGWLDATGIHLGGNAAIVTLN